MLTGERLSDAMADAAQAYGVEAIYNMQRRTDQDQRNRDTQAAIRSAHVLRLAANSGASYLAVGVNRHWADVREALERGVSFRVILLDPVDGPERALRNRENAAGERDDGKLPLGDIIHASNRYPQLEVRFAKAGMTCTVFLANEVAFFDPNHLAIEGDRISNLFLCLRARRVQPPQGLAHYDLLSRHFETLWRSSTPLREWLETNGGRVEPLPILN